MTTKEKIVFKSIELFNEKGINNVSTKLIADECNINQGNLYYYFKKKEEILNSVFEIITEDFSSAYFFDNENTDVKTQFDSMLNKIIDSQEKYIFLYRDLFIIFSDFPNFKKTYKEKMKERFDSIRCMLEDYSDKGYVRKEIFEELDVLISFQWFNISLWRLNLEAFGKEWNNNEKLKLKQLIYKVLYEYLTESGKKLFLEFI